MPAASAKGNVIDFIQPDKAREVGGELETTTKSLAQRLSSTTVTDTKSLEQAVLDRQAIGDAIKRVEDFFAPFKQMAHRLHRALCDRETEILTPLKRVDAVKRTAISDYKAERDRIRQAQERELAEQRRREDEARAMADAELLAASGQHQEAAAVLEEAIAAPAPVVALTDETKGVEGLKFTRRWLWRYRGGPNVIKDTPPEVLQRAMQLVPRDFCCVDEKKVGQYVRSMKSTAKIPGIEIYYVDDPVR